MTHLSDFSFLQRMVSFGYLYVWYTYRVWTLDRFSCLHPKRFKQGELKSIVTLLILFMIPFQLFYDITSVKIKYEEGFANVLGHVFTKPEIMWTKADKDLVIPTEYSLCIGFSLQTGTLVLLQCFWNYLANSVAKASFMSSREFMFYIFWTCSSFVVFPLLQYNFSRDIYEPTYKEIMPEMVYGIELFIVACLGVVSHFRFRKLLNNSRDTTNGRSITQKIRYFQEVNLVLSTVLFGHGTLLTVLSCDGLTGRKTLNIHKFSADFFICNINMCAVITWFCMILIFHPKHSNSPNAEDEFMTDENNSNTNNNKTIDNNSGISSNYAHASTIVLAESQISSDYTYKGGVHPLSKSGNSSQMTNCCDSAFQFGPLPITPPVNNNADIIHCRKNNSIVSTAPSMTTLVSHRQHSLPNIYHGGSNGKSSYKTSSKDPMVPTITSADYFPVSMPVVSDDKNINNSVGIDNYYHHNPHPHQHEKTLQELEIASVNHNKEAVKSLVLQPICNYKEMEIQHQQQQQQHRQPSSNKLHYHHKKNSSVEEEQEYVPPPLSPARKNRDVISSIRGGESTHDNSRRRYTHSMIHAPCDEDMGEFGMNPHHHQKISTKQQQEEEEEQRPISTSTIDNLQKQQALNNSMLTSFREFGENNNKNNNNKPNYHLSMSHSTSSLLLPLPFEFESSQSLSSHDIGESNTPSRHFITAESTTFEFLPPPPTMSPPPPPHNNNSYPHHK